MNDELKKKLKKIIVHLAKWNSYRFLLACTSHSRGREKESWSNIASFGSVST